MQKSQKSIFTTKWGAAAYKGGSVSGLPADGVGKRALICIIININKVLFWNSST